MSQIGRKIISIPENIEIKNQDNNILVKGKLGELQIQFNKEMKIDISNNTISVSRPSDQK